MKKSSTTRWRVAGNIADARTEQHVPKNHSVSSIATVAVITGNGFTINLGAIRPATKNIFAASASPAPLRPDQQKTKEITMRKSVFLALVVLLTAAWIAAQTYPGQAGTASGTQTSTTESQASTSSQNTIQGCVSGSENKYTLTDPSGNTYQLIGETAQLGKHVGQEVELTGSPSSSSATGMPPSEEGKMGEPTAATGAGTPANTFNVSKIKKISDTCRTTPK